MDEHSAMFDKIKGYYDDRFWNKQMVYNMVAKKKITEEEYTEITGKQYE